MNCNYCGTELPVGALFCGECGRAVGSVPSAIDQNVAPPSAFHWLGQADETRCDQCGAALLANDIFCGECGYITRQVADSISRPRDTVVFDRIELESLVEPSPGARPGAGAPQTPTAPIADSAPAAPKQAAPKQAAPKQAAPAAPPTQAAPLAQPAPPAPVLPPAPKTASADGARRPDRPTSPEPISDGDDIAATRIVRREKAGDRFVLQFSTGESFTVYGTGLVGRNPKAEPGEYFDQLVRVFDPSRSVSKTHLEFGQEAGVFWIKDRFSGNGTIAREPDSDAMRCVPDTRVRIERGTRVEIGEQFFIVS